MSSRSFFDLDTLLDGPRFRAVARVGGGGVGDIYEGMGDSDDQPVVVKLLRGELGSASEAALRMRREGEVLKLFDHRNIVRSHGYGTAARGRPYVVLERILGCTL